MIKQAYESGLKNAEFHLSCTEALARESNTTLGFVMTAGLGSLGYTFTLIEKSAAISLQIAVGALSIYLLTLAGLLVHYCLKAKDIMPAYNEPKNLVHEGNTALEVMKAEISNLQDAIDSNKKRNEDTGEALNRIRYGLFFSPIVFILAWVAVWLEQVVLG